MDEAFSKRASVIAYREGYKYQLAKDYSIKIDLPKQYNIATEFIDMKYNNLIRKHTLFIKAGYAWDGPSGPTFDTKTFMRGSLIHDALYQCMRQGLLPMTTRNYADRLLQSICIEDGMSKIRAWYVYKAVNLFAEKSAMSDNIKEVLTAP